MYERILRINQIQSSGLGRIYGLMEDGCVGFISAFRKYRSLEENMALSEEMKKEIRRRNLGYVPVLGTWEDRSKEESAEAYEERKKKEYAEGKRKEKEEVEYTFAISSKVIGLKGMIAHLVEIDQSNPEYNQISYLVVSKGIAYFVSGTGGKSEPGTIIADAEKFRTSLLDKWIENIKDGSFSRGKSTMARGPKGRSFTWSCGQFVDLFEGQPTFCKPYFMGQILLAKERVFGNDRLRTNDEFINDVMKGISPKQ
jgi:hypothetical protein